MKDRLYYVLKRGMPDTLFWRSLMIVVLPIVLLQLILTVVFYNRHWDAVTRFLAEGVAGEVSLISDLLEEADTTSEKDDAIEFVRNHFELSITFEPYGDLQTRASQRRTKPGLLRHIDEKILTAFEERLERPFLLDLRLDQRPDRMAVFVQLEDGLLEVVAKRRRVTSTTTWLLLTWMIGSSTVLTLLAVFFLRLQIRPIKRLAKAVDSFGKGRDIGDVRAAGAMEVRLAARAFNRMRARTLRHMSQRTEMLAAVSHDLRTPMTRMKLALEFLGDGKDDPTVAELRGDVEEMRELVETYLDFARGEGREPMELTPIAPLLEGMKERAERAGASVELDIHEPISVILRPLAIRRSLGNLVDNACRYGRWIGISALSDGDKVEIAVEDDGPGIPAESRNTVLQPFVRLEQSRSRNTGGLGLGLTIARDVILGHGGELILGSSSRGGLKATVRLPV